MRSLPPSKTEKTRRFSAKWQRRLAKRTTRVLLTKVSKPSVSAEGFFIADMAKKSVSHGIFLVLTLTLAFFSCVSNHQLVSVQSYKERSASLYVPDEFLWQKIENADFAEYFFFENRDYPVRYHCVRIDLSFPRLEIITFPKDDSDFAHKKGMRTDYFKGLSGKQFAQAYNPLVSVNTAPFGGKDGRWSALVKITSTRKIRGIHIVERAELSPPVERYAALCLTRTEDGFVAKIVAHQTEDAVSDADFAFGGFFSILSDFQKNDFARLSNDSRTAVGLSADGRTLYLLVVEGEWQADSHGLTYPECADIMLALGAKDAMQMDGGGSSSLFINGKNALSYTTSRKNAVFLGFR